jgi:hypothetical protein
MKKGASRFTLPFPQILATGTADLERLQGETGGVFDSGEALNLCFRLQED